MDKKLLTAQELAVALNLSVETIWRYTREGSIPTVKLGKRQYRYDQKAVLDALSVREESMPYASQGKVTYHEYAQLPEEPGYSYELIDGVLIRQPSPVIHHQRVCLNLYSILKDYFREINPQGEVFAAPLDVVFSKHTVVQPDLLYIVDINQLTSAEYIDLSPLLVVEVLSKSGIRRDRIQKLEVYRQYGVLHYWIVNPNEETIEAFKLEDKNYMLLTATNTIFEHPDFPGLSFDMAKVCHNPQSLR